MTIFDIKPYSAWKAQWEYAFEQWESGVGDTPRTAIQIQLLQECARRDQMLIASLRTTIAQQQDTINEAATPLEQADKRIGEMQTQLFNIKFQHDAMADLQQYNSQRIAELEAAWCGQRNLPAEHCRENHDGALYAEGCAP